MNFNSSISALICNIKVSIKHNKLLNKCRYSNFNISLLEKLIQEGIIASYEIITKSNKFKEIEFKLNSFEDVPIITDIKQISKPSQRIYVSLKKARKYIEFSSGVIFSTNIGLLNYAECYKYKIGGELILVYQ